MQVTNGWHKFAAAAAIVTVLTACTGNSSTGGDKQSPDPVVVDIPIAYVKRPVPKYALPDTTPQVISNGFSDARLPYDFAYGDDPNDTNDAKKIEIHDRGGSLWVRERAAPSAKEVNITDRLVGVDPQFPNAKYDVRDVSASYDGKRLLFSMRAPKTDVDPQPTWNIWEYDRTTDVLHRVISSDSVAETGEDVAPQYLPDGRIVFSSTRQRQSKAILLDEGKQQFSYITEQAYADHDTDMDNRHISLSLHVMDADGNNIHQISFNQSIDNYPSVLQDGRIIYTRWDNQRADPHGMHLYTMNPDGSSGNTQLTYGANTSQYMSTLLYGLHSHDSAYGKLQFLHPQQLEDGRIAVIVQPFDSKSYGGDLVAIDTAHFVDINQHVFGDKTPGTAQQSLAAEEIRVGKTKDGVERFSPGGRFNSAYPLFDGSERLLISWSQCRLIEPVAGQIDGRIVPCTPDRVKQMTDAERQNMPLPYMEAEPFYGLYVYDHKQKTQSPIAVPDEGWMYTDLVALAPRKLPVVRTDVIGDPALISQGVAIVHIRSVYDRDGKDSSIDPVLHPKGIADLRDPEKSPANTRPYRFIRIEKAVSIPPKDVRDIDIGSLGFSGDFMREIVGYVPVEPDGSAKFKVPANVALSFTLIATSGTVASTRHINWLNFKAGEVVNCNGCHTTKGSLPHGRAEAEAPSINSGATALLTDAKGVYKNTDPNCDSDGNNCLVTQDGETMAETWSRIHGPRVPSLDIQFNDDWAVVKQPSFIWRFRDMPDTVTPPTSSSCLIDWSSTCRTTINYLANIQPIWDASRPAGVDAAGLPIDNRCTGCHSETDLNGMTIAPAGHLHLSSDTPEDPNLSKFVRSYAELFQIHNQKRLVGGVVENLTKPHIFKVSEALDAAVVPATINPLPAPPSCDAGVLRDATEKPPVCLVCPVGSNQDLADPAHCYDCSTLGPLSSYVAPDPVNTCQVIQQIGGSMRAFSPSNSFAFFGLFTGTGSHRGRLTAAEIKLLKEWLDLGGQYYNDPFAAPER